MKRYILILFVFSAGYIHAAKTDIGRKEITKYLAQLAHQRLHKALDDPKALFYLKALSILSPQNETLTLLNEKIESNTSIEAPQQTLDPQATSELVAQYADGLIKKEFWNNIEAGNAARFYFLCAEMMYPGYRKALENLAFLKGYGLRQSLDDLAASRPDFENLHRPGIKPKSLTTPISRKDVAVGEDALQCAAGILCLDPTSQKGTALLQLGLSLVPGDTTGHFTFLCLSKGFPVSPPMRQVPERTMLAGLFKRYQTIAATRSKSSVTEHLAKLYLVTLNATVPDNKNIVQAVEAYERQAKLPELNDLTDKAFEELIYDGIAGKFRVDEALNGVLPKDYETPLDRSQIRQQLIDYLQGRSGVKYPLIFSRRDPAVRKSRTSRLPVPTTDEKKLIDAGLSWLAGQQQANGVCAHPPVPKDAKSPGYRTNEGRHGITHSAHVLQVFLNENETPASPRYGFTATRLILHLADYLARTKLEDLEATDVRNAHATAIEVIAETYAMTKLNFCKDAVEQATEIILTEQQRDGSFIDTHRGYTWHSDMVSSRLRTMLIVKYSGIQVEGLTPAIERALDFFRSDIYTNRGYRQSAAQDKPTPYHITRHAFPLLLGGADSARLLEIRSRSRYINRGLADFGNDSIEEFKLIFRPHEYYLAIRARRFLQTEEWEGQRKTVVQKLKLIQNRDGSWNLRLSRKPPRLVADIGQTVFAVLILQSSYSYRFEE